MSHIGTGEVPFSSAMVLSRIDANGDGELTPKEVGDFAAPLIKPDDGFVSKADKRRKLAALLVQSTCDDSTVKSVTGLLEPSAKPWPIPERLRAKERKVETLKYDLGLFNLPLFRRLGIDHGYTTDGAQVWHKGELIFDSTKVTEIIHFREGPAQVYQLKGTSRTLEVRIAPLFQYVRFLQGGKSSAYFDLRAGDPLTELIRESMLTCNINGPSEDLTNQLAFYLDKLPEG